LHPASIHLVLCFYSIYKKSAFFSFKQSHEVNRHAYEKIRKKKKDLRRAIHDQNKLIDQLLATSVELDNKVSNKKNKFSVKNSKVAFIMHDNLMNI